MIPAPFEFMDDRSLLWEPSFEERFRRFMEIGRIRAALKKLRVG